MDLNKLIAKEFPGKKFAFTIEAQSEKSASMKVVVESDNGCTIYPVGVWTHENDVPYVHIGSGWGINRDSFGALAKFLAEDAK